MACNYKLPNSDAFLSLNEFKAYLVNGGLEELYPGVQFDFTPKPIAKAVNNAVNDVLDDDLKAALGHLGDVLGDMFGAQLKATGKQYSAKDLLPALSQVVDLLIKKGFVSFQQSVTMSAQVMRTNDNTAKFIDNISPRQWRAAYNAVAEDTVGTDSESVVNGLSDDNVLSFIKSDNLKQGTSNEFTRDGSTSQGTLEGELPGALPGDDSSRETGRRSTRGGSANNARNRNTKSRWADGTSSVGRGENDIHSSRTGEYLVESGLAKEIFDDFVITDDNLGQGTYGEKLAANMAAIRLVKQLESENRNPSKDEQEVLSKFIGWGGLKNVFDPQSKSKQEREALKELESLLDENELFWAKQGTLAQHFTSPEVIDGIYNILGHLGFKGGNTLEPTVGVGNFIGRMPVDFKSSSNWYGSEIDPIPGKIAKYLYPDSKILTGTGFQKAEFPYSKFDLAIGNPPFGNEPITDKNPNRKAISGFKIHNYIIAKSAMHLKPGGVMAFVVTNRFLDTRNNEARAFLAENFNMIAAIRLPNDAFKKNANTEVTTDVIFLQKRIPGQSVANENWLNTNGSMVNADGENINLNQYFADNPAMMLGKPSMQGTMYGNSEQFTLIPYDDKTITEQINALLDNELSGLKSVIANDHNASMDAQSMPIELNRDDVSIGGYIIESDKIFMRLDNDEDGNAKFTELTPATKWTEKQSLGLTKFNRIKGMLELRAKAYELVNAERADKPNIEQLRTELNGLYDTFIDKYGYLNSTANAQLMSGDIKIEYGLEKNFKKAISAAKAKSTGFAESKEVAEKADILKQRVFYPYKEILAAENPRDGYAISLSEKGYLDLDYIAKLTGLDRGEIINDLSSGEKPLIFKNPETGEYEQEDKYLSGNVKKKLKESIGRRGFEQNVAALKLIQPKDVTADDIFADIGQTWIPGNVYEQFLSELGVNNIRVVADEATGGVNALGNYSVTPSSIGAGFTNSDYSLPDLFNLIANKRPVVAYDVTPDSKTVNQQRTKELQILAKRMTAFFRDWIFTGGMRTDELVKIYNDTQNTTIPRKSDGNNLRMVGANQSIQLRDTQKSAAWRMIQQSAVLLDHVVGAGKTYTIITGIMERKRLGLSKKPMVVVPNHLVSQWSRDFMALYPGANILAASEKDFAKNNRRKLFARIATGNYDAVIVGHSSFKLIPVDRETEQQFIMDEVRYLEDALSDAISNEDKRSVRTIRNRIAKRMQRIERLLKSPKDDVATFQQMGIDYLTVDESHEFKNLEYATAMKRVPGMGNPNGSERAFDLYMKLRLLLDRDNGGVTFATGTPISNSLVEMYSIMRYLNKPGLVERKIESFDAWAKNYASIDSVIEYMATGKLKDRNIMGSFNNVPEMMQLYNAFADIVTMSDLKRIYSEQIKRENAEKGTAFREEFPVPKIKNGGRQLVNADPSEQQLEFIDYLVERTLMVEEEMKSQDFDAKHDNLLWIYNDAKKAALDIRLVDPTAQDNPDSKVNKAVANIARIHKQWEKDSGTQLVFIDMSTPKKTADKDAKKLISEITKKLKITPDSVEDRTLNSMASYQEKWRYLRSKLDAQLDSDDMSGDDIEKLEAFISKIDEDSAVFTTVDSGFSVYDDIKKKLVAEGIPHNEIQFIHDYNTKEQKQELFSLVNSGKIRVLLGSTPKMGAGTNVQERLVALHHIDASQHNRPSDIEQREGRIIRQGNKLFERDPDNFEIELLAYSTNRTFDAVSWQTLAKKAKMLESFRTGARRVEEDQGDSAGYMEFMAETTGNPVFREKVALEGEISELEAIERRLTAQLSSAKRIIENEAKDTERFSESENATRAVIDRLGKGDSFSFDGETYKNDYEDVLDSESKLYYQELRKFNEEMEKYTLDREAWEKLEKGNRGKPPSKPKFEAEEPTIGSARMQKKSSMARGLMKLADAIEGFDSSRSAPLRFKFNDQSFTVTPRKYGKDDVAVSIHDPMMFEEFGFTLTDNKYVMLSQVSRIVHKFSPNNYRTLLAYYISRSKAHQQELIAAKEFVDSNVFDKAEELAAKKKRFEVVRGIVDAFEQQEADRRSERDNKYMRLDTKRFGNWQPGIKQQAKSPSKYQLEGEAKSGRRNPVTYYSIQQNQPTNPHTESSLKDAIRESMDKDFGKGWTKRLLATDKVKLVSREEAMAVAGEKAGNAQGFYNPKDDTTYLIPENISKDDDIRGLLLHEIGVHALNLNRDDQEFKSILSQLEKMRDAGNMKVKDAFDRVPEDTKPEHVVEESLAYLVQHHPKLDIVKRFFAWLRQAIRNIANNGPIQTRSVFNSLAGSLSTNDIMYMAENALRSAPDSLVFDNVGNTNKDAIYSIGDIKAVLMQNSEPVRDMPHTNEQWRKDFPNNLVQTPIGEFKLGENQFAKLMAKDRGKFIGLVKPTLENPTYIIKNSRGATVFVKSFTKEDGKFRGFMSVSYDINGLDVVVSNHPKDLTDLAKEVNSGHVLYPFKTARYSTVDSTKSVEEAQPLTGGLFNNIAQQENDSSIPLDNNDIHFSINSTASNAISNLAASRKGDHPLGWLAGFFQRNHLIDFALDYINALRKPIRSIRGFNPDKSNGENLDPSQQEVYDEYQDLTPSEQSAYTIERGLKDYKHFSQEKDNIMNGIDRDIDKKYKEMQSGMTALEASDLGRVQAMATRDGNIDPEKIYDDEYRFLSDQHKSIVDAYKALTPKAKEAYKQMRKDYQDDLVKKRDVLKARINEFDFDSSAKSKVLLDIQQQFDKFINPERGVYFPLSRFGQHVLVGKYYDNNGDEIEDARVVSFFESIKELDDAAKILRDEGYETRKFTKEDYIASEKAGNAARDIAAITARTLEEMRSGGLDINDTAALDEINQMLINALPDSSYRKHFIHRKGTLGSSTDTLRAYANTRHAAGRAIASIQFDHKISEALRDAKKAAHNIRTGNDTDVLALTDVLQELSKREDALKQSDVAPWAQTMTSLGFFGALGFNVSSAATNLMQVPGVAFPELAGKFGTGKAFNALKDAYGLMFDKKVLDQETGFNLINHPELQKPVNAALKRALSRLAETGKIDLTQTHDAVAMGRNASYSDNIATRTISKLGKYSGYMFHVAEAVNRQIVGIAAFKLAMEKHGDFERAYEETVDAIDRTQFDYSAGNRARYMMGNTSRVLTLFKAYALGISYYLGRVANQALKGATPEERLEARKTMAVQFAMTFATSGLFGLPIGMEAFTVAGGVVGFKQYGAKVGAVGGAIAGNILFRVLLEAMGADDDDELEHNFRNWATDNFGVVPAEFMAKGPMRLLGIDVSGRLGLDSIWWRQQNKELEGRDAFNAYMNALLGPVGSQIQGYFVASQLWEDGNEWRAVEQMSPALVRNAMAAYRMGDEGVNTLKGDRIIDRDLTLPEIIAKGIGFNPAVVADVLEANSAIKNKESKIALEKQHLLNRYFRLEPKERMEFFNTEIKDFNNEVAPSERITKQSLLRSMQSRKAKDKRTKNGLYLSGKRDYLRDEGRFARAE